MTAYNHMGWLCDEPRVPRHVPDRARTETLEVVERGALNQDHLWFVSGAPPYELFVLPFPGVPARDR